MTHGASGPHGVPDHEVPKRAASWPDQDPLGPSKGCIYGIFLGLFIIAMTICLIRLYHP